MKDNFYLKEGRVKVIDGIAKATLIIKSTYGAAGSNVIVEEPVYPFHRVTNDGKLIVEKIKLADPLENVGANIIKEAGDKADKDSGDGRKTTMILTEALFRETSGIGANPMDIKRSLDECVKVIFDSIDSQKKEIGVDDVKAVATVSSENESIGRMLQEIYQQIGKDGIVEVDHSNLPETFYEVTEGVRLRNARFFGEYSLTEPGKAVYKNPKILISKDKITSVDQLEGIMRQLVESGTNELVIYCDDIDMSVAARLAMTHLQGGFKSLIIKAPTLWKDWLFEDFAKITGATPVDQKEGKTFKNLMLSDLGSCEKIITTKEETRVIGIKDISEHLAELKARNTDEAKLRAAWLQTKVAVLKVGANSESELSYVSKKANDACNASYLALKDGVVVGGGLALFNASKALPDTLGGSILRRALRYPIIQIMVNTGKTPEEIEKEIAGFTETKGFNAHTREAVDMFEAGIIDPALVIKNAVKNAVSIASTVITSGGVILLPKESNENQRHMPGLQ